MRRKIRKLVRSHSTLSFTISRLHPHEISCDSLQFTEICAFGNELAFIFVSTLHIKSEVGSKTVLVLLWI